MALTIYGSRRSRTMRTLWIAAELGLAYEHVPLTWDDPALKSPWFLALNPAGTIPTIVDDGFALSESMAINLYLAKMYGGHGGLYPATPEGEAEAWRWSLWAQAHIEPWVQNEAAALAIRELAPDARSELLKPALKRLDQALSTRRWLVGDAFTVADLNVAGVLSPSRAARRDVEGHENIQAWLVRCYDRPASLAVRSKFAG